MAVNLDAETNGGFDFGDLAGLGNQSALSFSLNLRPTAGIVDGTRIFHQWGASANQLCVMCQLTDTDEIGVVVSNDAFVFFGRKTTDLDVASGTLYRIVVTIAFGSPPTIHIYVNGIDKSLVEFVGSNNVPQSLDSVGGLLQVGRETAESTAGVEGDYSEFAIWQRVLTSEQANEFTANNRYPSCCGPTGLLYLPMRTQDELIDQWGGVTATLTGGGTTTHPTMVACAGNPFFTTVGAKRM